MHTHMSSKITICASGLALAFAAMAAELQPASRDAESVVHSFNAAFAAKDIERLVSYLVDGGVQFDLRPAHADQTTPQGLTQELRARWYGVTPILFAATQSYQRKVEILHSRADQDMATVWARITTEMLMPDSDKPSTNTFTEVYMLVKTTDGWQIGAMIDNRETDNIATAGPPAKE